MSVDSNPSKFFFAGGTLRADAPSYVKRPADNQLFYLAQAGEFCYVLTPRQMGKSSLMSRTANLLRAEGIRVAIIDLSEIGAVTTADQWYFGLITSLQKGLESAITPNTWWAEKANLSPVHRFTEFLRYIILAEPDLKFVIFIDEIDTTLKLDFSDDFFAAIRAIYNKRADDPEYNRLTFVFLGVAAPSDLMKDQTRTPFNIGQGIDLREFSREDAQVLQQGLAAIFPSQGETIFNRIFYWTNGYPYLTQKLCLAVAETGDGYWGNEQVDELVKKLFLSEEARRKETHLGPIRASISNSLSRRQLLTLYHQIYQREVVPEDERSPLQNQLKLIGLVRTERNILQVRNEIYRRVFDQAWIKASMPVDWTRRIAIAAVLLVVILVSAFGFYIWQQEQRANEILANTYEEDFTNTTNPTLRLDNLANLFGLEGYDDKARVLFTGLPPDEQIALFTGATPELQPQVRTVIKGVYTELGNTEESNLLLTAMRSALESSEEPASVILVNEIARWLDGRAAVAGQKYEEARLAYKSAIDLNDKNPATYFERALVLVAMANYEDALADFEVGLNLDKNRQEQIQRALLDNPQLYEILWKEKEAHPALIALVPTPTHTSMPAAISTPVPPTTTSSPTSTSSPTVTPTWTSTPSPTVNPTPVPPTATFTPTPTPTPLVETDAPIAYIGPQEVIDVDINPGNPQEVFVVVKGDGIYKSSHGGDGPWGKLKVNASGVTAFVIDPHNPATFYASSWNAVLKSTDGGNTWEAYSSGLSTANRSVDVITVHPENPNIIYGGIGETLIVSTDGGKNWSTHADGYGNGLGVSRFYQIVVDPFNNDIIYVGGAAGEIYKSADAGRNFIRLGFNVGEGAFSLAAHPNQKDVYLAGINSYEAGIIKTENGVDFRSVSAGLIFGGADSAYSAITYAPSNPDIVYTGSGYEDNRVAKGIFKSTNGGESWQNISNGWVINPNSGWPHYVKAIAVHPTNPDIVLAATGAGLYRSADGGATWRTPREIPPEQQEWILIADSRQDYRVPTQYGEWVYLWAESASSINFQPMVDGGNECYRSPNRSFELEICRDTFRDYSSGGLAVQWKPHQNGTYRFEWDTDHSFEFLQRGNRLGSAGPGSELPNSRVVKDAAQDWDSFTWWFNSWHKTSDFATYHIRIYMLQEKSKGK
ncbi:MAG: AAA-like domain-containing protein [Anaerolineae bacterium]|nr:AAA-like domain-containing protein [Anaerolineae bacterium]